VHSFLTENGHLNKKQALETLVKEHGINPATAATQYYKWAKAKAAKAGA
jgi:hypothetical protein